MTVTVSGGTETCTAPAVFGTGSCDVVLTASGNRNLTASYPGDANFNASTDNEPHVVHGETSTALSSSLNPSNAGDNVTFTAHVTATSGTGSPTGQVKFFEGALDQQQQQQ